MPAQTIERAPVRASQTGSAERREHMESSLSFGEKFLLESGYSLPRIEIAYETFGTLNNDGTNAIVVCHALTGNAHAGSGGSAEVNAGWWDGIIGKGKGLDTDRYFVVCSNILGSCYGTTGPTSLNPATGRQYRTAFPQVSVRDMVRVQKKLLDTLGVRRIETVIGGSLGGMQVLEWGILYPDFVRTLIPIATSAKHSAWCIGISEAQRLAIMSDPAWEGGNYTEQPAQGLALARMIAMISYRSRPSFEARFGRTTVTGTDHERALRMFDQLPYSFQIESYLRYQGQKLVERFDANTYLSLSRVMDLHDVSAGRGSVQDALGEIKGKALCIGISSDVLYPVVEQQQISEALPQGHYAEIESIHGHDAFLIEFEALNGLIRRFLE